MTPEQRAVTDAAARAKTTGQPVVVDALTTERSQAVVKPDGRLSVTESAREVRTKKGGGWADLDPTLHRNPDGTLGPAVSSTGLALSGGGTGPMATLTTEDSRKLAVTAPFALPAPTLDGASALYPNVLPDVDLKVTALPAGGWRDVLVVRTAAAAANPALRTLRFATTTTGLTVGADASGNISVTDDTGKVRFGAPPPQQWDSGTLATAPATAGAARSAAQTAAPADPGTLSTPEAPGDGAKVASIAAKVTSGGIELTPDPAALGQGTGPWYLDPTLAATSTTQGSAEVQENVPGAQNYNKQSEVATGYCGFSDCAGYGRERAYFQFSVNSALFTQPSGAPYRPTVFGSTLYTNVTYASSNGTQTPLAVYWAPRGIDTGTNWYNQPCGTGGLTPACPKATDSRPITGYGPLNFDVTGPMQQAARAGGGTWTIVIAPDDESRKEFRHRIASNPVITTDYDITPSIWYPRFSPYAGFASTNQITECNTGGAHPWDNAGWIGNNQNIYLAANSWSPAGFNLSTSFQVWDDNDPNFGIAPSTSGGNYNNPGSPVPVGSLADGHQYGFLARASDGTLTSDASAWCYFRVDRTNPRLSIGSADFPPSGTPNDNPTKFSEDAGTFTFYGQDPAPGPGLLASGVACFRYSWDSSAVTGWHCGDQNTVLADGNGNASKGLTPPHWGTNILWVQAQDNAGNYSQPATYAFYAPFKPGSRPVLGDTNGDRIPDILVADADGSLRVINGNAEVTRATSATAASAPRRDVNDTKTTWKDYQVTHRGALNKSGSVDQIIAHNTVDPILKQDLYLLQNDGSGHYDVMPQSSLDPPTATACANAPSGAVPCPATRSFGSDWSNVSQIVAIGTPEGEQTGPSDTPPGQPLILSKTSLLAVVGDQLWLLSPGIGDNTLDRTARLIPSPAGAWSKYDLINPGNANGPTITADGKQLLQTTVWARNRDTGDVRAYPITGGATPDFSALTNPDAGTLILSGAAAGTTRANYPRIGSSGDLNGDGLADLWAIDNNNVLQVWRGTNSSTVPGRVTALAGPNALGNSTAAVEIQSVWRPDICADAWGGTNKGGMVAIYSCYGGPNQQFTFGTDGTIRHQGLCLSTTETDLRDGVKVSLDTCDGRVGQSWVRNTDGTIRTAQSGYCLELPGWADKPGTQFGIWSCTGNPNQAWSLPPVTG
ncbi:ricin-type beta-trefoil lectin domain protein [Kitasatospora sp. SUK 42]|uniref:ricin-type beta-trefoil lectin domain protein n=1 Tax=Kitasatospora sp. SUK 42 TaxID=1588882 RepID=UPI0018CBD6CB|nr:ricin-type beta-trefoil lectin domain protein [Kitasatospora sp. SUK 42]MBV2156475.1 ricin-type beta-trefoil lectin domain protein [Kitasatospora sp. SUK 42]